MCEPPQVMEAEGCQRGELKMSSLPKKMEHRLSLKEGFQADSVDSECNTPQGFLYETKFVVLNYLGLVPPDLDPGYSEFDIHYESSSSVTPFGISDDDRESTSSSSRRSSDLLSVNIKKRARHSPKISPRSRSGSSSYHASPAVMTSSANVFPLDPPPPLAAHSAAPPPEPAYAIKACAMASSATAYHTKSSVEVTSLERQVSFDSDLSTDAVMDGEDDVSHSQPLSGGSEEDQVRENPEIRIDDDSTGDSWEFRQRQRRELVEPLREEVRQAMTKLQEEFKQVVASGDGFQPILPSVICPLNREALVAERIAQIGDKIMLQRGEELEKTMQMFFGSQSDDNLTYSLFTSLIKQMMKSTVPGWYHLALMLKFTRQMALGLVNKGGQGFGSVTDFAVRYIEENLAQTIIDQGGWDAMTNINLDDINNEILSELSSRTPSPLPFSSQESHASEFQEPLSPDAGTPVDSPNWKTEQQSHFTSSGEEGLNQLRDAPPGSSPNEITHRSRSESRPEELASLFIDDAGDPTISHSMSSPSGLGMDAFAHTKAIGVTHSDPGLSAHNRDDADSSQGFPMDVDSQPSSSEHTTFSVGDSSSDGDTRGLDQSGEQKSGIGKVAAAVAGAAGAILGIRK